MQNTCIMQLQLQDSAAQKDRNPSGLCWATCTWDFILISSWQSSQTDWRGAVEFIISTSPIGMHYRNDQSWCIDIICTKMTLFYFTFILYSLILTLLPLYYCQTAIRSLRVVLSPGFNLCNVLICVCKCLPRWAASSTELKDSLGSDSLSRVHEPASAHWELTSDGNSGAFWELWAFVTVIVTVYCNTLHFVAQTWGKASFLIEQPKYYKITPALSTDRLLWKCHVELSAGLGQLLAGCVGEGLHTGEM